jgi:hypothetical protein
MDKHFSLLASGLTLGASFSRTLIPLFRRDAPGWSPIPKFGCSFRVRRQASTMVS